MLKNVRLLGAAALIAAAAAVLAPIATAGPAPADVRAAGTITDPGGIGWDDFQTLHP